MGEHLAVPFFTPQVQPLPLPTKGASIERAVQDWKAADTSTPFHKAKDVAAFANHLGGALLIGAREVDGQLAAYVGMDSASAGAVRDAYSKAVTDRCLPKPQFDFDEYVDPDDGAKRIVVVNVWPSLLLIGVRIDSHKPSEGYGGPSYVYPVRTGTDATYLDPTQISMYMTRQVRRVAVMLSKLPENALVHITNLTINHKHNARLVAVREHENVVQLRADASSPVFAIPLDCITTVFKSYDGTSNSNMWQIYVDYSG